MSAFYEGMAEILEVEESELSPSYPLDEAWDSLAIVSTIALIDELFDFSVSADALAACTTIGEVEALVAARA